MGTASLVFGLILIGSGFYILFVVQMPDLVTDEEILQGLVAKLIIAIPAFVIGGLLLRKYDRDRKKEKS